MPAVPPAFDPVFYRARHDDLAAMDDAALVDHWRRHGRDEGRAASPLAGREGLVAWLRDRPPVLEIGPFHAPLMRGPDVEYLDMLDADGLRARAAAGGSDPAGVPETIHHVGGLARVDRRYAAVIASHSIEHHPDLVGHLLEVERVLEPDGVYALVIPDKRYCFDALLPESGIADVLDAHETRRRVHSLKSVIEHHALTTHNDARRHWAGDSADPRANRRAARVAQAIEIHARAAGGYVDVHAWQFTPAGFAGIVGLLRALGLIRLEAAAVHDTLRDRNEFTAVLRLAG